MTFDYVSIVPVVPAKALVPTLGEALIGSPFLNTQNLKGMQAVDPPTQLLL